MATQPEVENMSVEPRSLAGKAMLITGAGRGIGLATALHLARNGAAVAVNDVDDALAGEAARMIASEGHQALAVTGSVADWEACAAMVDTVAAAFGSLDGLVNNAGLHYQAMPWDEVPERVRATVEVNVLGSIFCATHAARRMRGQAGGGAIVNIASAAAIAAPERAVYGATKGAILSYTANLAGDLAPHRIRVNALSPFAATRMTDPALADGDHGARSGEFAQIPGPEAMAPVIAWLLSDAAAGVTGRTVRFNGRQLSLIAPAALARPILEQEQWSAAELDQALGALLRAEGQPLPR